MPLKTLTAHFDGKHIQLDEPVKIRKGTKLLVIVLPEQGDAQREEWLRLSVKGLEKAYNEDEIDYSEVMVKEVNPDYEGR